MNYSFCASNRVASVWHPPTTTNWIELKPTGYKDLSLMNRRQLVLPKRNRYPCHLFIGLRFMYSINADSIAIAQQCEPRVCARRSPLLPLCLCERPASLMRFALCCLYFALAHTARLITPLHNTFAFTSSQKPMQHIVGLADSTRAIP